FKEFKRGRSSVSDEERSGRPADVVTEEIVEKVHDTYMILADRRTKVHEVAEAVSMSYNILHDNLRMKKLSTRWMPRWIVHNAPAHSSAVATAN
ncbi:GVQW3 protein, partial [Acromyrmex insinuator]